MASRGYIPEVMKRAGIDMMHPGDAAPLVYEELVSGGGGGEVLLAGSLGLLMEEAHPTGGLDAEARAYPRSGWTGSWNGPAP